MFQEFVEWVRDQLSSNEFATGGLIVVGASTVLYVARTLPLQLWNFLERRFTLYIEVRQPDPLFDWIGEWVTQVTSRATRLSAITTLRGFRKERLAIVLVPGVGLHLLRYGRSLFVLYRVRQDPGAGSPGASSRSDAWGLERESYVLYGLRTSRGDALRLLEDVRASKLKDEGDGPDVYVAKGWGGWERVFRAAYRSIDSVVLGRGIAEASLERCRHFLNSRDEYARMGIPWRMGMLLCGPPGNGKTSFITALASELHLDVGILNLAEGDLSDSVLLELLGGAREMIVIIEDVDALYDGRIKVEAGKTISFSGLLNAIDGVAAGAGRIVVLTTNHPEKLDPALIRRGRIDMRVEVRAPDEEQLLRLWERFMPGVAGEARAEFVRRYRGTSMADAQDALVCVWRDAKHPSADTQAVPQREPLAFALFDNEAQPVDRSCAVGK